MKVVDDVVTNHEAGGEVFDRIRLEYGVFGEAHPKMVEITGLKYYNFKLTVNWNGDDPDDTWDEFGLVSDDGTRIYFKSDTNSEEIEIHELISQVRNRNLYLDSLNAGCIGVDWLPRIHKAFFK